MTHTLRVAAPAKVNLTLEVTGLDENGYHTLDTLFCCLELEDQLELRKAQVSSLSLESDTVSVGAIETDDQNLVLRALRAVEASLGRPFPTQFHLRKQIPAGGGLGGGSADAAATLIGLNRLYQLDLSPQELLELARPLGADVSFGLLGGLCRGRRYGDLLERVQCQHALCDWPMVLVMPPFGCPTPSVYKLWDQNPSRVASGATERFLQAAQGPDQLDCILNDLEDPATHLRPGLASLKQSMVGFGLHGVCLAGSGSTLFGFLPPGLSLDALKEELTPSGSRVLITKLKEVPRLELDC